VIGIKYHLRYRDGHIFKLKIKDFSLVGGNPILEKHANSLPLALSTAYPGYDWLPWKFDHFRVPSNYWDDVKNKIKFLDFASKELKIKELSDWYKITSKVLLFETFLMTIKRIFRVLVVGVYWENTKVPFPDCYPLCTLTTNGCHGNLKSVHQVIGMKLKIREILCIGLQAN
jgi:hypothetical protein